MKSYLRNWDFMRIFRLVIGIIVLIQGIQAGQWMLAALGGFFALMPLLNVGCCGASGCATPTARSTKKDAHITYEEIKAKP